MDAHIKARVDAMTLSQATAVLAKVREAENARKNAVIAALEELKASGVDLDPFLGGKKRGRKAGATLAPSSVRYHNPADTTQTWNGRGRRPAWANALIASGKNLDHFRATV